MDPLDFIDPAQYDFDRPPKSLREAAARLFIVTRTADYTNVVIQRERDNLGARLALDDTPQNPDIVMSPLRHESILRIIRMARELTKLVNHLSALDESERRRMLQVSGRLSDTLFTYDTAADVPPKRPADLVEDLALDKLLLLKEQAGQLAVFISKTEATEALHRKLALAREVLNLVNEIDALIYKGDA